MAVHQQVTRRVEVTAPVERVWQAVSDPEVLERWFGAAVEWELRAGARGTMREPGGELRLVSVDDVVPARRLIFQTWPVDRHGRPASVVKIDLSATATGTTVTVTETALGSWRPSPDELALSGGR